MSPSESATSLTRSWIVSRGNRDVPPRYLVPRGTLLREGSHVSHGPLKIKFTSFSVTHE